MMARNRFIATRSPESAAPLTLWPLHQAEGRSKMALQLEQLKAIGESPRHSNQHQMVPPC
jgi:hypothetical protein